MFNFVKKTALTGCLLLTTAFANATLITNGSFEQLTFSDNSRAKGIVFNTDLQSYQQRKSAWDVFTILPGWQVSQGSGMELQKNVVTKSQHGNHHIELDSSKHRGSNSAMTQTLNSLTVGNQYLLEFFYKPRTNRANDNGINVFWYDANKAFSNKLDVAYSVNTTKKQTKDWAKQSVLFTASAESMKLSFSAFGRQNTLGGLIDNVSLNQVASVPEPAALLLFLPGLAFMLRRRKA